MAKKTMRPSEFVEMWLNPAQWDDKTEKMMKRDLRKVGQYYIEKEKKNGAPDRADIQTS